MSTVMPPILTALHKLSSSVLVNWLKQRPANTILENNFIHFSV